MLVFCSLETAPLEKKNIELPFSILLDILDNLSCAASDFEMVEAFRVLKM